MFRDHFASLCELAQSRDVSAGDHDYAMAFRGIILSHILMPQRQADAIIRGAFARFWQHRFSTTLQAGNVEMLDLWLRRRALIPDSDGCAAPGALPADLSELLCELEDEIDSKAAPGRCLSDSG